MPAMIRFRHNVPNWLQAALLVGAGYVWGAMQPSVPTAQADPRTTPPREAFLSGSERSEAVLKEIHRTLQTIDGRVAKIEAAVLAPPQPPVR